MIFFTKNPNQKKKIYFFFGGGGGEEGGGGSGRLEGEGWRGEGG